VAVDLAVRLPNWIGDVCMALPTLEALGDAGCALHCYGRPWAPSLLRAAPYPVTALPRGVLADSRILRGAAASRVLLLTGSFSSAAAAKLAGMSACGERGDLRRALLAHPSPRRRKLHEVERFWYLGADACTAFGLDLGRFERDTPQPALPLDDDAHARAAQLVADLPRPWIVCCPTATGTVGGHDKRWPGFADADAALRAAGFATVCCPGPGEAEECRARVPGARHLPDVDLPTYAALCARADAVLANDSGPMHLAAAGGGRVLGVFGVSDPARYRPWGGRTIGGPGGWPSVDATVAALGEMVEGKAEGRIRKSGCAGE